MSRRNTALAHLALTAAVLAPLACRGTSDASGVKDVRFQDSWTVCSAPVTCVQGSDKKQTKLIYSGPREDLASCTAKFESDVINLQKSCDSVQWSKDEIALKKRETTNTQITCSSGIGTAVCASFAKITATLEAGAFPKTSQFAYHDLGLAIDLAMELDELYKVSLDVLTQGYRVGPDVGQKAQALNTKLCQAMVGIRTTKTVSEDMPGSELLNIVRSWYPPTLETLNYINLFQALAVMDGTLAQTQDCKDVPGGT